MSVYQKIFRPLLFQLDPERAHALTLGAIRLAGGIPPLAAFLRRLYAAPLKPVQAFGLTFKNPVGLAAGYDKDGLGWRGLASLGFGHIEVGTVTPLPQPGNPRPRVFRIPEEQALINRMGFPGRGAAFLQERLSGERPAGLILGVNIGKNKDTPLESAANDYLQLMRILAPLADYLAINVSSPNTVGLRRLQARQSLDELLQALERERAALQQRLARRVPLLVKLSPDLSEAELYDALDVIGANGMDGVIATNTTIDRSALRSPLGEQAGGVSGAPLTQRSTELVRLIAQYTQGALPIIAVGGILTPADARQKLDAGAVLVQVYTGLIYAGPSLVQRIVRSL